MRFSDQLVIVTGGTRGLGRAATLAFLAEGAQVIATFRSDVQASEELQTLAGSAAERLTTTQCDVSNPETVAAFWEAQSGRHVAVLVNNAGIRRDALLPLIEHESWEAVLGTNLTGGFLMTKHAIKSMLQKRYGRVLFITSPTGPRGVVGQSSYGASKMGQVGLARSLAREVGRKGITVNCLSPGIVRTALLDDMSDAALAEITHSIAARRLGTPKEIADAILFMTSPEASYINGTTLEVTGGI